MGQENTIKINLNPVYVEFFYVNYSALGGYQQSPLAVRLRLCHRRNILTLYGSIFTAFLVYRHFEMNRFG